MKRSNFHFETVLIAITAVLAFSSLFSEDAIIMGALWLIVLGVLQLFHSFFLSAYWQHEGIRKALSYYWIGVVFNFILMFVGNTLNEDYIYIITILVLPLILALYLWFITYKYRARNENSKSEE